MAWHRNAALASVLALCFLAVVAETYSDSDFDKRQAGRLDSIVKFCACGYMHNPNMWKFKRNVGLALPFDYVQKRGGTAAQWAQAFATGPLIYLFFDHYKMAIMHTQLAKYFAENTEYRGAIPTRAAGLSMVDMMCAGCPHFIDICPYC